MSRPIGVLYVIDELRQLGGAERNLLRMLQHLPGDRFRPYVLTFHFNEAVEAFRAIPCPIVVYPVHNLYSLNPVRYAPRLLEWIRQEQIRIVHTFFETADLWAGVVAHVGARVRLVSGRRDLGIQRNWRLNVLYRLLGGIFDQVQAVSDQVRDYVIQTDRLDPARVVTVPNSIELDRIPQNANERMENRPVITTVANIRHVKGIDVLVRTAAQVVKAHPEALFVVAGRVIENEYYARLTRLAAELGIAGNVRFLGELDDPLPLLARSDVFFLPSRSEGMSNALLEAMASSLPSVATAVGGNCQLIQDDQTGFLVPSEDVGAAAGRIIQLLDEPEHARHLGHAARRLVEEQYSVEAVMRLLVRQYEALLGGFE
jgi:glycosyltransferase involved in cell wall biosynthesis